MKQNIDAFKLKMIAITMMLINHIGQNFSFETNHTILFFTTELLGKITFPIMAYLLVEGFHHTRNVEKYMLRMATFWLISIYPFHLLNNPGTSFQPIELVNNIFFTLLMGLVMMYFLQGINNKGERLLCVTFFSFLTATSDWGLIGVLLIFGFYTIANPKKKVIIPCLYTTLIYIGLLLLGYVVSPQNVAWYLPITMLGILLVIPLLLNYNGQRGLSNPLIKWGFYLFYPVHMLILALIRYLII